jgi:hypothetical protein
MKCDSKPHAGFVMATQAMITYFNSDDVCECRSCEAVRAIIYKELTIIRSRKAAKVN